MADQSGLDQLRAAVERAQDHLTKTDRLLVQELLGNPAEAAVQSAAELAGRVGAHASAVVRLARKLGFAGYPEMRAVLRDDLFRFSDVSARVRDRVSQSREGAFLDEVIERELGSLGELRHNVPQAQIDAVAEAVSGAGHVLLFGQGHALSLMHLLGCRLARSGYRNTILSQHGVDLAAQAALLQPGDVVIAFAFFATPFGWESLMDTARKAGAVTVLIADVIGFTARPKPDHLLVGYRGRGGESLSLTVSMAICNALILSISKCDDGRSLAALRRYTEYCERYLSKSHGKNG